MCVITKQCVKTSNGILYYLLSCVTIYISPKEICSMLKTQIWQSKIYTQDTYGQRTLKDIPVFTPKYLNIDIT